MQGYPLKAGVMVNGMGLVVGRYGRILRTTNGGLDWYRAPYPTTAHLHPNPNPNPNTNSNRSHRSGTAGCRPRRSPAHRLRQG